jgi:hypothetical protein
LLLRKVKAMHRYYTVALLFVLLLSFAVAPAAGEEDVPEPGVPPHHQKIIDDVHASLKDHHKNTLGAFGVNVDEL